MCKDKMMNKLFADVNDNPPEFASKYYFASIREGEPVGTDVVQLMASSRDAGVNAEITYSIIGGNEGMKFMIKADTGLVSVAGEIDHERAKEYFLTIQALDGGSPPLSNHATVNISIMDVNDNKPIFTQLSYSAGVGENSPVGSSVITLTATDLDQVKYSWPATLIQVQIVFIIVFISRVRMVKLLTKFFTEIHRTSS